MINDESLADAVAQGATPPADETPAAEQPTEPSVTPTRRRTATPRTARPRKTAAKKADKEAIVAQVDEASAQPELALDTPEPAVEASPAEPAVDDAKPTKPKTTRPRRTTRKKAEPATEAASETALPETVVLAAEAAPTSDVAQPVEAAVTLEEAAPAEAPAKKPARRRTTRKKTDKSAEPAAEAPSGTPAEVEAPTAETSVVEPVAADEAPTPEAATLTEAADEAAAPAKTSRRRSSRRRKTKEPVVVATEPAAEAPEAEVVEEDKAVTAPTEKTSRRRRDRTKRATAAPAEDLSRGARLVMRKGAVELNIRGTVYPPVFFFGNMEGAKEARRVTGEIQRAAKAGVHLHSTLIELPCPLPPDDSVYEAFDTRIQSMLEMDPEGYLMPRLVFVPAPGWRRQYPNEVIHYADGSTGDPSIASDRFWQEAEHALAALAEHVDRTTYSDRVIGYHLERGEWFHPADTGYDRSFANREAFRAWLRVKYKNSEAALRAAWYDGQVQFYTVEIPPLPEVSQSDMAFFEARKERRWVDFLEFTSDITADRLIGLSKAVKTASGGRALVSVCYGYTYEFSHTFSGHLALGRVLAAPSIDLVAGPPSYRNRQPGGAGFLPAPADSMPLHGKLWVSEDDTKTHLAPNSEAQDDYNPRMNSSTSTEQVQLRSMGKALASQFGIAWMDLWGEGWLDSDDIWERIGKFTARNQAFQRQRRVTKPEVAIIVDERSLLDVRKGDTFIKRILHEQRDMFQRSGATVGYYLQSDVTSRNFPTDAKLYIFLNPYRLPAEQRAAIREKLQRDNKTLVWMYAVGIRDERTRQEDGSLDIVGITRRAQSWGAEVGSRITEARHQIADGIQGKPVGVRERLTPSFFVDDEEKGVVVLGEYVQSGLPSIALRRLDRWSSVFCGEPTMSSELFTNLCRYAGVHLYTTTGDDYVYAGDGWLTLHATKDGTRNIRLPRACAVYDLIDGRLHGADVRDLRVYLRANSTRTFYCGSIDEMIKMGLPGVTRGKTVPPPATEPSEASAAQEPSEEIAEANGELVLEGDDEILEPIEAVGDDEDDEGEDSAEGAATAGSAQRRRRRRRGGRGRGRRHRPAGDTGGESGPPAPSP